MSSDRRQCPPHRRDRTRRLLTGSVASSVDGWRYSILIRVRHKCRPHSRAERAGIQNVRAFDRYTQQFFRSGLSRSADGLLDKLSRRGRCNFALPIATFSNTRTERTLLRSLLYDEWCAALWTWLRDRLVRRSVIAIRIPATAIENSAASATF